MRCATDVLPDTDAALFPVQENTLATWREIYNQKVTKVPTGAWMTEKAAKEKLAGGGGYFVHRDGKLLGIGLICDGAIDWVASVQPGAGKDVVCALNHAIAADTVSLTVASANEKAVALYEKLGFVKVAERKKWYLVHGTAE
jgi:RimJ/RimL family protein N-acetyltransferase